MESAANTLLISFSDELRKIRRETLRIKLYKMALYHCPPMKASGKIKRLLTHFIDPVNFDNTKLFLN